MDKLIAVCIAICLLSAMHCDNNNPSNETPAEKILGSWMLVRVDEFLVYDEDGVKDTTNETYAVTLNSEWIDFYTFIPLYVTYYEQEDVGEFIKTDSIPYIISGNELIGDFWKGTEIDPPSDTASWSSTIDFSGNQWIYEYVEQEVSHEGGYYFGREAYTMYYVPLPDSINLDSLQVGQNSNFVPGRKQRLTTLFKSQTSSKK